MLCVACVYEHPTHPARLLGHPRGSVLAIGIALLCDMYGGYAPRSAAVASRGRGVASLPCPICGRLFSADTIAEHADSCAERLEKVNRPKAPAAKSITKSRKDRSAEAARARDRPAGGTHRASTSRHDGRRNHAAKVSEPSFYIPANLDSSVVTDIIEGFEFRAQSSSLHPKRRQAATERVPDLPPASMTHPPPQLPVAGGPMWPQLPIDGMQQSAPPQSQPPRDAFVGDNAANGKQPMYAQPPAHPPYTPGGVGCTGSSSASCTAPGGAMPPSNLPSAVSAAAPEAPLPPAPSSLVSPPSCAGGQASEAEPPPGSESSKAPAPASEAERFLAKVRELFADDADKQQRFTQVMRGFFLDELDTPDVMEAMAEMLRGHWALLRQFNRFLPEGFRIEQLPPCMSGYHVCHVPDQGPVSHADAENLASQFVAKLYKRFEHSPKLNTLLRALLEIPGESEGFSKYSATPLQLIEHIRPILQTKEHEDLWREFQQYMPRQAHGHVMVAHDAPSQ